MIAPHFTNYIHSHSNPPTCTGLRIRSQILTVIRILIEIGLFASIKIVIRTEEPDPDRAPTLGLDMDPVSIEIGSFSWSGLRRRNIILNDETYKQLRIRIGNNIKDYWVTVSGYLYLIWIRIEFLIPIDVLNQIRLCDLQGPHSGSRSKQQYR